jgi:hypothetical protein
MIAYQTCKVAYVSSANVDGFYDEWYRSKEEVGGFRSAKVETAIAKAINNLQRS